MNLSISWAGSFLSENCIGTLKKMEWAWRWVHSPLGPARRKIVAVELNGRRYFADRSTGSLFDVDSGVCCSADSLQLMPAKYAPKRQIAG